MGRRRAQHVAVSPIRLPKRAFVGFVVVGLVVVVTGMFESFGCSPSLQLVQSQIPSPSSVAAEWSHHLLSEQLSQSSFVQMMMMMLCGYLFSSFSLPF